MINRILTEKIKSIALGMGMDLIGFGPVGRWKDAPYLMSPMAILPDGKSVIVTGIHITDTWTEMGGEPTPHHVGPGGWMDQNSLLDRVAFRISRVLNEYGYKAVAVASSNIWRYRRMEGLDSLFSPDLSHILASCAAGLTQIGWSGLAITPEYGPRVRYISIVTEAELEPSPMYNGPDLCDMCMECVKACPSQALRKDFDGSPREVIIEGKKFRYANKNIWRCAWAEHFNIDLKSPVLDQDHIDEEDIVKAVNEKQIKGHERGVCQKVCIPKHMRSDEPSFGRPEKKITMRKVNRKYSEDMPTLHKMRDDIIARAVSLGVDIAAVDRIATDNPAFKVVEREAPGMKTVIGFAFRTPAEVKEAHAINSYTSMPYTYALRNKMHHILLIIAKFVEEFGYHAASYTGAVPVEGVLENAVVNEEKQGTPIYLTAARLAEISGIGKIDGEFITDEFGSNVVIGAVVTDAPLDRLISSGYEYREKQAPTDPIRLKNKLLSIAEDNLVNLFGVASAETIEKIGNILKEKIDSSDYGKSVVDATHQPHGRWISEIREEDIKIRIPSDYVKNAKSVITLGMSFQKELISNLGNEKTKQIGTYGYYTYQTTYELFYAAMELVGYLNRSGYKTMVTSNLLGVGSFVDTPRGLLPDFRCSALEAVACGLGEIGNNGGLLTPEYGSHQRTITIITDAEIPADSIYCGKEICNSCGNCRSKCPMNAITTYNITMDVDGSKINYPMINRNRCDWAKRYSLNKLEGPELIGNTTNVIPKNDDITIEEIAEACNTKDQVMKCRSVVLERCLMECTAGGRK